MTLIDNLFDHTVPGLVKSMDLALKRNEALASNIANAETPQYRAVDVNFAGELEQAFQKNSSSLAKTNPKHLDVTSASSAHLIPDLSGATRADGNNVDLDIQMGKMVFNSGKYSLGASLVRKKLHMMRMAIRFAMR